MLGRSTHSVDLRPPPFARLTSFRSLARPHTPSRHLSSINMSHSPPSYEHSLDERHRWACFSTTRTIKTLLSRTSPDPRRPLTTPLSLGSSTSDVFASIPGSITTTRWAFWARRARNRSCSPGLSLPADGGRGPDRIQYQGNRMNLGKDPGRVQA